MYTATNKSCLTFSFFFFFSSRRRHTRLQGDWSSDVCSSDLAWIELGVFRGLGLARSRPDRPCLVGQAQLVHGPVRTNGAACPNAPQGQVRCREIGRASCRGRGEVSAGARQVEEKG